MTEPNKPARGMDVLAWCLQAWHYMRQNRVEVGPGLELRQTSSRTIISVKRRKGGGSAKRAPWAPEFFTTGSGGALVYKCRFNLGTVNHVPAGNWNAEHTLPSDDAIKFVVLTITTASGKVTGVAISLDTDAPTEDVIAKDTPPVTHKIVLGAVGKTRAQMIVDENLTLLATEVFRETKTAPATGGEPFSRWWRWSPYQPAA
jgi:hypothetical protein